MDEFQLVNAFLDENPNGSYEEYLRWLNGAQPVGREEFQSLKSVRKSKKTKKKKEESSIYDRFIQYLYDNGIIEDVKAFKRAAIEGYVDHLVRSVPEFNRAWNMFVSGIRMDVLEEKFGEEKNVVVEKEEQTIDQIVETRRSFNPYALLAAAVLLFGAFIAIFSPFTWLGGMLVLRPMWLSNPISIVRWNYVDQVLFVTVLVIAEMIIIHLGRRRMPV